MSLRIMMISPDELLKPMGGLGEHIREVSKSLVALRDDVFVDIVEPSYGQPWELVPGRIKVYGLKPLLSAVTVMQWDCYESIFRLQTVYLEGILSVPDRPDIIHAQDWSIGDAARVFQSMTGVPLVTTIHLGLDDLMLYDSSKAHAYFPKAVRAMRDMQNGLIENSHALCHVSQHYARRYGNTLFAERETIVGNGVDLSAWTKPLDKPFQFPGRRPKKLVYIGRFAIMKNLHGLLNAKLPDDVDLCVIGCDKGCERDVYETLRAHASRRDDVHLLGPLYGEDKVRCMRSAWAGVFPSLREPFGIVGLEWMASRRPMIATYVDGMNDYLLPGMAVRSGQSPNDLSMAIASLSTMSHDEMSAMTATAWRQVQLFSWRSVAQRTLEAYDKARNTGWIERCLDRVNSECSRLSGPEARQAVDQGPWS